MTPYTYYECVQGREAVISPSTMAASLKIDVVDNHFYALPIEHPFPSYDVIITKLSRVQSRKWIGEIAIHVHCLTSDYHLLHLALCGYILPTTLKSEMLG